MSKEGVNVTIRIRPVTAIALAIILIAGGASAGWVIKTLQYGAQKIPVLNTILPTFLPQPTESPDPWRETAYSGILRKVSEGKYYLQTGDGEAVTLSVAVNVNLEKYIGKRILAAGRFNKVEQVLYVEDAADLEYVISATAIPTLIPSPTPIEQVEPTL